MQLWLDRKEKYCHSENNTLVEGWDGVQEQDWGKKKKKSKEVPY